MPSKLFRNRNPKRPHLLRRGLGAEIADLREDLLSEVTNERWTTQTAWVIDPTNGSDTNLGTPSEPLKTMGEFNTRMQPTPIRVPTTLLCTGDVIDEPLMLNGTRFPTGSSLTVSGTATTTASGTITGVTTLQSNSTWQLTTTGVSWTSGDVGKRMQLSTGFLCWVQEVLGSNSIVVGPVVNSSTITTPAAPVDFVVQSLSRLLAPTLNICSSAINNVVFVQDADITAGPIIINGGPIQFFGCRLASASGTSNVIVAGFNCAWRACFWSLQLSSQTLQGAAVHTLAGHTMVGAGSSLFSLQARQVLPSVCSISGISWSLSRGCIVANLGAMHFRNTANPITIGAQAGWNNANVPLSGSVGNSGVGITVRAGCGMTWTTQKPTVTGATDTLVGSTSRTYAQLPYVDLQLNAIPPSVQTLATSPAFITAE